MKTKKKTLFYYLVLFWVVIYSSFDIYAQKSQDGKCIDEIKLAEQIPTATLSSLTTEELIQEYLNSRYPGYILIYNDIQDAFKHAYNDFNGLRELLQRQDAATKLIEFYQKMDPSAYDLNWSSVKKGSFTFSFVFIEVLLAHERILDKITRSETKVLLSELLKKNEYKILHPEKYSVIGVQYNVYSIAKLLESKGKNTGISQTLSQTPEVNYLLKTGSLQNDEVISFVIQKAREFLSTY